MGRRPRPIERQGLQKLADETVGSNFASSCWPLLENWNQSWFRRGLSSQPARPGRGGLEWAAGSPAKVCLLSGDRISVSRLISDISRFPRSRRPTVRAEGLGLGSLSRPPGPPRPAALAASVPMVYLLLRFQRQSPTPSSCLGFGSPSPRQQLPHDLGQSCMIVDPRRNAPPNKDSPYLSAQHAPEHGVGVDCERFLLDSPATDWAAMHARPTDVILPQWTRAEMLSTPTAAIRVES